jgi:hypothetical protein
MLHTNKNNLNQKENQGAKSVVQFLSFSEQKDSRCVLAQVVRVHSGLLFY